LYFFSGVLSDLTDFPAFTSFIFCYARSITGERPVNL
jgi:hypothetical protein